jgi:sialate O-acetylesterase
MAVTIDLGEWNDIHPENKKDVGGRLALLARKYVYEEKKVLADGPTIERAVRKGNTIVLHFQSTGSGLMFQGNLPPHFFVQNNKFEYARATAVITSKTIVLKGIDTATAKKVMYAYANNPAGGMLYNREGLPASPFQIEVQ